MKTAVDHRSEFVDTITHIRSATMKVMANAGNGQVLSFPDAHKISEGLFLSAVTHWEELCQILLITDLAFTKDSLVTQKVKKFRTKNAPFHLAEAMLSHIDRPNRFYDWSDFKSIKQRADTFLDVPHRYHLTNAVVSELGMFKRIRNSVAHKSDRAWDSFMKLIAEAPFNLTPNQRKGITPGRFLCNQKWAGKIVIDHVLDTLEAAANTLVP
jgi:hypothetical protein